MSGVEGKPVLSGDIIVILRDHPRRCRAVLMMEPLYTSEPEPRWLLTHQKTRT